MERSEDQEAAQHILGLLWVWTQQVKEVWRGSATTRVASSAGLGVLQGSIQGLLFCYVHRGDSAHAGVSRPGSSIELSQKPRNSRYTAGYRETFRFHVNGNQSAGCSQFFFYPTLWNITAFYLRGRNIIYELARFITTLPPFGWI